MRLLLTKFWPILIPIAIYLIWVFFLADKLKKQNRQTKKEIFYTTLATLITAIGCLVYLYYSTNNTVKNGTNYTPAYVKDGKIIPGKVK